MPDLARTTYDEISDAAGLLEIGVGQLIRVMVVWADATGAARKTMMSMGRHYNQKEILLPSFHFRLRDLKHTMPLILRLPKTPGNAPQRMADECEQARGLPGWLKVHIIWQAWKLEFPYWAHSAWRPKVKRQTLTEIRAQKEEEELLSS